MMEVEKAIACLRQDLERYAQRPTASPRAIAFRTDVLNSVIDSINELERQVDAAQLERDEALRRMHDTQARLADAQRAMTELRQWCRVHDVDLDDYDRFPTEWKSQHLERAVEVAGLLRHVDGVKDRYGMRTLRTYRNNNAFAYNVINSVAQEESARQCLRRLGCEEPPADLPMLLWPIDENTTTT